jgi:hypothetical protein
MAAGVLCAARPASALETSWLGEVNKYRVAAGLVPVSEQAAWRSGIEAHLRYLALTPSNLMTGGYESMHSENPQSQYYTLDGAAAGQSSNLGYGGTDVSAIDGWLTAPFHAIGILRPALRKAAFARDPKTGAAGLDVIRGLGGGPPATAPVLFPGPGMTTDLSAFAGGESPDPLETCGWKEAGLPLIALLTTTPSPQLKAQLDGPRGFMSSESGGLCVVSPSTYRTSDTVYGSTGASILSGDRAVILIPKARLLSGTYNVRITQPGVPDIDWSFTVDRDPGLVLGSDAVRSGGRDLKLPVLDSKLRWIVFSVFVNAQRQIVSQYDWRGSTIKLVPVGRAGDCPAHLKFRRCKSRIDLPWEGFKSTGEDGRPRVELSTRFTLRDAVSGFSCPQSETTCDVLRSGRYRLTLTLRGKPIPGGRPVGVTYSRMLLVEAN